MVENIARGTTPDGSLIRITNVVYALHALSVLIGVTTPATVVGAFVFGLPSIIAVIINYVKRPDAKATFLESHFRWQIRTFWFAALWCVVAALLFLTILGIPLAFLVVFAVGIWVIYRIARGWWALRQRNPVPQTLSPNTPAPNTEQRI
jgi:uncharacterized membrane protein